VAIKIAFKSGLKDITGVSKTTLDRTFNTFEKAMQELIRLYPGLKDELFYSDGSIDFAYQIFLNDKRLSWPENKETRLKDGDELIFFIFMAGG